MKKNLWLTALLALLLVLTYFLQEKRMENVLVKEEKNSKVLSDEIHGLAWGQVKATKKDGRWWQEDILLSQNKFKQIEKKLSQIKKMKDLPANQSIYFKDAFSLEVNQSKWIFGDMTLDRQGFYLAVDNKAMVAYVDGGSNELTQDESDLEKVKKDELIGFFQGEVKETQLFRFYPNLELKKVRVDTEGAQKFELDFELNSTVPAPIPGVQVLAHLREKFLTLMTQITVKEQLPFKKFYKRMSVIEFLGKASLIRWEVWLLSNQTADVVLVDPDQKKAYSVTGGTLKVFFVQLQDYWDKKVIPSKSFSSFDEVSVELIQGNRSAKLLVGNREPLEFKSEGFKINTENMNLLFRYVFNLDELDQASRVSLLTTTDKKLLNNTDHLKVNLMGQELILMKKTQELIVANLTQGFKAHFSLLDDKFNAKFEDMLK